ncbi:chromatin associated protein KTI12, partial [Protomyces lactucae-debilis]
MPLLTITGYPSAGKSLWACRLKAALEERIQAAEDAQIKRYTVVLISDDSLGVHKSAYAEARREKEARGLLFSAIERELSKTCIVINDSLNYIKGFRYQLSCSAKAVGTPHCLVQIGCPPDACRRYNEARQQEQGTGYTAQVMDELIFRYEEPNPMTRWDSPCFTMLTDDAAAPIEDIWKALVLAKTARPNASTVMKQASEGDYLYELDRATQAVIAAIVDAQRMGAGGQVQVAGLPLGLPTQQVTLAQLQRLKRQFSTLQGRLGTSETAQLQERFVEFLN